MAFYDWWRLGIHIFFYKDYKQIIERRMRTILNELFNKGIEPSDRKNRVVVHTLRHTFECNILSNFRKL